jgi:hypothetical protein
MEKLIENATQKQVIIGALVLVILFCLADNLFN